MIHKAEVRRSFYYHEYPVLLLPLSPNLGY